VLCRDNSNTDQGTDLISPITDWLWLVICLEDIMLSAAAVDPSSFSPDVVHQFSLSCGRILAALLPPR